jgi:glucose-6-phosphate isomerase
VAPALAELFEAEPDRLSRLTLEEAASASISPRRISTAELLAAFRAARRGAGPRRRARGAVLRQADQRHRGPRRRAYAPSAGRGRRRASPGRRRSRRMRALIDAIEAERSARSPHPPHRHRRLGARPRFPDRRARPRCRPLRDVRGRLQRRRRRAGGGAAGFDPAATLLVIASKTFTTSETMLNAAPRSPGWRRAASRTPMAAVIALTASPERGDRVRRRRDPHPALLRDGRRPLFALVVDRLPGRARARLERVRGAAGRRRRDGPALPPRAALRNAPVLAAFVDRYYANVAAPRPAPSSPMTSGCGCSPPISSSWRWNRTARA